MSLPCRIYNKSRIFISFVPVVLHVVSGFINFQPGTLQHQRIPVNSMRAQAVLPTLNLAPKSDIENRWDRALHNLESRAFGNDDDTTQPVPSTFANINQNMNGNHFNGNINSIGNVRGLNNLAERVTGSQREIHVNNMATRQNLNALLHLLGNIHSVRNNQFFGTNRIGNNRVHMLLQLLQQIISGNDRTGSVMKLLQILSERANRGRRDGATPVAQISTPYLLNEQGKLQMQSKPTTFQPFTTFTTFAPTTRITTTVATPSSSISVNPMTSFVETTSMTPLSTTALSTGSRASKTGRYTTAVGVPTSPSAYGVVTTQKSVNVERPSSPRIVGERPYLRSFGVATSSKAYGEATSTIIREATPPVAYRVTTSPTGYGVATSPTGYGVATTPKSVRRTTSRLVGAITSSSHYRGETSRTTYGVAASTTAGVGTPHGAFGVATSPGTYGTAKSGPVRYALSPGPVVTSRTSPTGPSISKSSNYIYTTPPPPNNLNMQYNPIHEIVKESSYYSEGGVLNNNNQVGYNFNWNSNGLGTISSNIKMESSIKGSSNSKIHHSTRTVVRTYVHPEYKRFQLRMNK